MVHENAKLLLLLLLLSSFSFFLPGNLFTPLVNLFLLFSDIHRLTNDGIPSVTWRAAPGALSILLFFGRDSTPLLVIRLVHIRYCIL